MINKGFFKISRCKNPDFLVSVTLYVTIIGVLLAGLLGCVGFYVYQLSQRIDTQSDKIARLDKNFAIVVSVLNIKMPNANLPTLLTLSSEKNTPTDKVATVIPMLERNTEQAKVYLKNEMYFSPQEVNAVMSGAPSFQKKPLMKTNPVENKMPIN